MDRFLQIAGLQLRAADELWTFFDQMIAIVIWSTLINFYETDTLELCEMLMSLESTHWSDHNMSGVGLVKFRGADFLAQHAHHESFEYPSGSCKGDLI